MAGAPVSNWRTFRWHWKAVIDSGRRYEGRNRDDKLAGRWPAQHAVGVKSVVLGVRTGGHDALARSEWLVMLGQCVQGRTLRPGMYMGEAMGDRDHGS